jgi:hypothetical protein
MVIDFAIGKCGSSTERTEKHGKKTVRRSTAVETGDVEVTSLRCEGPRAESLISRHRQARDGSRLSPLVNHGSIYQPDFIVFDKIILELKARSELHRRHRAQVHNYLKATGLRVGLLVNFGAYPQLERHRIIR